MQLCKHVVAHAFSDDSGIIIYNTISDESVLLDCRELVVTFSDPNIVFIICNNNEVKGDIIKKGMAVEK